MGTDSGSGRAVETDFGPYFSPCNFSFSLNSEYEFDKLTATVVMPSGQDDTAYIYVSSNISSVSSLIQKLRYHRIGYLSFITLVFLKL